MWYKVNVGLCILGLKLVIIIYITKIQYMYIFAQTARQFSLSGQT